MLLLDANIPIYAHGREHFYRAPCRTIMGRVKTHPHNYAVDTETFQEIWYIYSRRGQTALGVAVTEALINLRPAIIPITIAEIRAAIRLLQDTPGIAPRDAIHSAVVMEHGLDGIVSADRDVDRIPGLRRYDPADLAAAQGAGG